MSFHDIATLVIHLAENIATMATVTLVFLLHFSLTGQPKNWGISQREFLLFTLLTVTATISGWDTGGHLPISIIPILLAALHTGLKEALLVALVSTLLLLIVTNSTLFLWTLQGAAVSIIGVFTLRRFADCHPVHKIILLGIINCLYAAVYYYVLTNAYGSQLTLLPTTTSVPVSYLAILLAINNLIGLFILHRIIVYLHHHRQLTGQVAQAEEKYRSLVENSLVGIYIIQNNKLVYTNPGFTAITGLSSHELLAIENIYDYIHPDDHHKVQANIKTMLGNKSSRNSYELRLVKADRCLQVEVFSNYILLDNKPAFIGSMIDITARRNTEAELRQQQSRLQGIIAAIPDVVTVIDKNGILREILSHQDSLSPLTAKPVLGQSIYDIVSEPIAGQIMQNINAALHSKYVVSYSFTFHTLDNRVWNIRLSAINADEVVSTTRDITSHKQIEMALRESEARFRYLAKHIPLMLWIDDQNGHCIFTNKKWQEFTGTTPALGTKVDWSGYVHPNDRRLIHSTLQSALERQTPFSYEFRMLRTDGEYRWVQAVGIPRKNADHSFAGYIGCCLDIHDKKHAENVLTNSYRRLEKDVESQSRLLANSNAKLAQEIFTRRAMEKRYRKLFDSVQDAIFVWKITADSLPGRIIEVNDIACRWLNYTRDELLSMSLLDVMAHQSNPFANDRMEKLLASRQAIFEFDYLTKDKRQVPAEVNAHLFTLNDELVGLCIARDIADRKQTELDLLAARNRINKADKLAFLGNMAAGIAHEINQPLNSIKVTADSILMWSKEDHSYQMAELLEDVQTISQQATRIANIIKYIRELIRSHQQTTSQRFNMSQAISNAVNMLTPQLHAAKITLALNLPEKPLEVIGSLVHMEHVILNLISNALEALEASPQDHKEIRIQASLEDRIIVLITDNGPGIPEEIRHKLFTPFFTTKTTGMGLGLSIVKSVITSHGGQISLSSNKTGGAAFRLTFPLIDEHRPDDTLAASPDTAANTTTKEDDAS